MGYIVALALIIFGIAVMIKPKLGDWGTLNDLKHKVMYGKHYYSIIRYVSGPSLILIGAVIIYYNLTR